MKRWARMLLAAVLAADRALLAARDRLSPGQRWTSALGAGLVLVVLLFGLPPERVLVAGSSAPVASRAGAPFAPLPRPSLQALAPLAPAVGPQATALPAPAVRSAGLRAPTPLSVVALVRPGQDPSAGRDDATIAGAFLGGAGVPWRTVSYAGDARSVCRQVVSAGTVVLAATTIDPTLSTCIRAAGRTLLAYDESGTIAGTHRTAGLLSTRRSDAATLADVARWARSSGALKGAVGVLADPARRARLERAIRTLPRFGVHVRAVAWVEDSPTGLLAMPDVVQQFAGRGVRTVLLATPVAVQDRFVALASTAGFHYVVTDVADGVVTETYPAMFDGAVAYTAMRVPWYARAHGRTSQQQACASVWQGQATPPVMLPNEEVTVDIWCEEVAAVEQAVAVAATRGGDVAQLLARLPIRSPLTSDLQRLSATDWGPVADAVVVWRAACGCWQEDVGFRARGRR